MSKKGKSAYGGPLEEKEVVLTIDKRLALGGLLVVVFATAIGVGALLGPGSQRVGGAPAAPTADATKQVLAEIQADMKRENLPTNAVIVPLTEFGTSVFSGVEVTPAVVPGGVLPIGTPDTPLSGAGGTDIELPPEAARRDWPPDVFAEYPDANLTADFQAARTEEVTAPFSGPRLGISDLNLQHTFNFGDIPNDRVAEHDFAATNVGDEDLIISRVYASCGCTATKIGDVEIQADGFLPQPLVLKPGESKLFTVQFDPRAETSQETNMSQAKYIQIYSNDPNSFLFDDAEPLSHEARFRIVMRPVSPSSLE